MSGPRPHAKRARACLRGFALYLALPAVFVYASVWYIVAARPVTTFEYGCTARLHALPLRGKTAYLRLRTWTSPHGQVFQIHRTNPLTTDELSEYYDDAPRTPEQIRKLIDAPVAEPEYIPRWSRFYGHWPDGIPVYEKYLFRGGLLYDACLGWPFPALRGSFIDPRGDERSAWEEVSGAFPITRVLRWSHGASISSVQPMPLIPYWAGFLGNVLFFAGVVYAVRTAWTVARGTARHRRGACPRCGYDLRATPERCPECGLRPSRSSARTPQSVATLD